MSSGDSSTSRFDGATPGEETRLLTEKSRLTLLFEQPSASSAQQDNSKVVQVPRPAPRISSASCFPVCTLATIQSTVVGSAVFLLYQVVFCLAQASTITRPHSPSSSTTAYMAQLAALGIWTSGPLFIYELGSQVPAIYPASDLFLAPFLAGIAANIDENLFQQEGQQQNDDAVFLATFGLLLAVGLIGCGFLCILAARVKLANLGAFLPHSVLCGFFTTIGILIWTLGFSVDVGEKVGTVLTSGDLGLWKHALLHHSPSVGIGILMHLLGPHNPLYVILLVFSTIAGSYVFLFLTGTTLAQAQEWRWFFSPDELVSSQSSMMSGSSSTWGENYGAPMPFGVWVSLWQGGIVNWQAFMAGVPMMISLVLLYLVRSSLHSAALKKNIPLVTRRQQAPNQASDSFSGGANASSIRSSKSLPASRKSKIPLTLGTLLETGYGYSQICSGVIGGIAVAPAMAASLTLFKLQAENPPPQYGSCLLMAIFYFTNFEVVQYIPKPAFSALMVLAGLDMLRQWMVKSYFKTKAKVEWAVGPVLVILSFSMGLLNAIFIGIAISTFIFVGNFYAAGAVKFVGSGLTVRSAVERGVREGAWLDQHGDWIQILVVQNYLFFGNTQSLLNYIMTMFEDDDAEHDDGTNSSFLQLPPKPKYVILDLSLVSGMDTSAVDGIQEIVKVCSETNQCQLFMSGLKPSLKANLMYAGLNPRPKKWMYTHDMETAMAKAEDWLLSKEYHLEEQDQEEARQRSNSVVDGFHYALQKIDEQHGLDTVHHLAELSKWMRPVIELEPGNILVRDAAPGIYFVETGLLRVQWSIGNTTRHVAHPGYGTLSRFGAETANDGPNEIQAGDFSIGHLNARSAALGLEMAAWKQQHQQQLSQTAQEQQSFRLARIGQGWIIGSIEASNGMKKPGVHIALSSCRLHHLPESALHEMQNVDPKLAMHLYRVLAHLATKRQEMTIDHLGQHLRILQSPAPRLLGRGRAGLAHHMSPMPVSVTP